VEAAPELIGARDSLDGFAPRHRILREAHRRFAGLRLTRSRAVFEAAVPVVLEQKVIGEQARRAYLGLVRAFGEPAPGPAALLVPPSPEIVRSIPYHRFHPFGVEMRRANVIRAAADRASRLEETASMSWPAAQRRLRAVPGFGPWTAARIATLALGDPDAVPLGDFHLPHLVAWAFAGEPRGTDERMLELLSPYAGHRARVLQILKLSGVSAPRFGPRLPLQHITSR
jgi:3-methyladenine DNA glycosylase/8-oxoguanine DNA glycosylase